MKNKEGKENTLTPRIVNTQNICPDAWPAPHVFGTLLLWREEERPGLDLADRNRTDNSGLSKVACTYLSCRSPEGGNRRLARKPYGQQGLGSICLTGFYS